MTRYSLIFFFLLLPVLVYAQDTNKIIVDEDTEKPMLIGYTTYEAFSDSNFSWWFNSEFEMYEPDSSVVKELIGNLDDVDITIVMGSWCSDSRREVPHLFKILEQVKYPFGDIEMISVNRDKVDPEGIASGLTIEFVPTFIFYRNESELGRIEEMPMGTLEKDMLDIVK